MRFHIFRCIGIIALGITAFFLTVMQGTYHWDVFFTYLLRDHINLLWGFVISLIVAALSLSLEQEKKE